MAGKKDGTQLCYFYCCSRRQIPEPGFWLLYQKPQQPEIVNHNTGLLKFWSSLYCPAQQPTGLRPLTTGEQLLREVESCPGSWFNHETRTVALAHERNSWILHATRCIYLGEGGFFLHFLPILSDKYIVDGGEVSELTAETHSKARWSNSAVPSQAICKPIGCSG